MRTRSHARLAAFVTVAATTGEKTMLDVLTPALEAMRWQTPLEAAPRGRLQRATDGRAAFLGASSVGHLDPGRA